MRALVVVVISLLIAAPVHAQVYDLPGSRTALTIKASPQSPAPGGDVVLTLSSPLYDLKEALITWEVDGETVAEGEEGRTSITVKASEGGAEIDVYAEIRIDDDFASAQTSIVPARLDLIWEADGLAPGLYRGRTLPVAGSSMTFVAYPTFVRGEERVPEKDLIFTWRRDGVVLGSLSGKGKSALTVPSPSLYDADTISVQVRTADGEISAEAQTRMVSERAEVRLYEDHPLFGAMLHRALSSVDSVSQNETRFLAIPYFAPAKSENDPKLVYEWRVNRASVPSDNAKPSMITINAEGSEGIAIIDLLVAHVSNFFYEARGSWRATFPAGGAGSADGNPFAPQSTQ